MSRRNYIIINVLFLFMLAVSLLPYVTGSVRWADYVHTSAAGRALGSAIVIAGWAVVRRFQLAAARKLATK